MKKVLVFLGAVLLMSSCVEGDLYDLYEETNLSFEGLSNKKKNKIDTGMEGSATTWQSGECAVWCLMVMKGYNPAVQEEKNKVVNAFIGGDPTSSDVSSYDYEYLYMSRVTSGGFYQSEISNAASALGIGFSSEWTRNGDYTNDSLLSALGVNDSSATVSFGKKVIASTGSHVLLLRQYKDHSFKCSDYVTFGTSHNVDATKTKEISSVQWMMKRE